MKEPSCIFKRIEKKYLISRARQAQLLERIGPCLAPDPFPRATTCSLYLDTPDHRIIRESREAQNYKEKLRLRSYGTPTPEDTVFLELKKKYDGVVYKRRVPMTLAEAERYLTTGAAPVQSQIMREIDYAMRFYGCPAPAMLIAYEREAWLVREQPRVRVTFDSDVRCRDSGVLLEHGSSGSLLLPHDTVIMEIKTDGAMPLWLAHALTECRILPGSFSKYGAAYEQSRERKERLVQQKGEYRHVINF